MSAARYAAVATWIVLGFILGVASSYVLDLSRGRSLAGTPAADDRSPGEGEEAELAEELGPAVAAPDAPADADAAPHGPERPVGTAGAGAGAIAELRGRELVMPIEGIEPEDLQQTFDEARGSGRHEALDILAPRDTPVRAVEEGTIAKLFASDRGGLTIYHFDPAGSYCYYYAHLERYAEGLREGQHVEAGEVIGYVGTSGNAPRETPHLHFAIFALGPEKRWWQGTPIDPYLVLR